MADRAPRRTRPGEEIWETTTDGRVWVTQANPRGNGTKVVSAGGKAGSRLRIRTEDREICEDSLVDPANSPFRNGLLVRVDAGAADTVDPLAEVAPSQALSTEELLDLFERHGAAFHAAVDKLNETNTRRLLDLVGSKVVEVTVAQSDYVRQVVRERYRPVGEGAQPTIVEMQARGEL